MKGEGQHSSVVVASFSRANVQFGSDRNKLDAGFCAKTFVRALFLGVLNDQACRSFCGDAETSE